MATGPFQGSGDPGTAFYLRDERSIPMNRNDLLNRLVARKMKADGPVKAFCVCLAKKLCFAGTKQPAAAKWQQ